MAGFDYSTEAELFPTRIRKYRRQAFGYKRFAQAADVIRFSIEELPEEFVLEAISKSAREFRQRRNSSPVPRCGLPLMSHA